MYRPMQATELGKWFRRQTDAFSTLISPDPRLRVDLPALRRIGTNADLIRLENETSVESFPHDVIISCIDIHDGAKSGLDLTLYP